MNRFLMLASAWALTASAAPASVPARANPPAPPATAAKPQPLPVPVDKVPPSQMVSKSSSALTEMRTVLSGALLKLEEARNSKDVVKLNCVNEKLTQVKGLLRISEQADVSLQEAVSKKEQLAAEHEYTKITIASEKVRVLRSETEECIGQLAFRTDQNLSVEVEVPDNLPSTDPTIPPLVGLPSTRPPPASPTQ